MTTPKTPILGPEDLHSLSQRDVHILDCSWYLPQELRDAALEFELAHIPGAMFLDWERCSGEHSTETCLYLPPPETFREYISSLGISDDDLVVVYDHEGFHSIAARAWWMFRVFGHKRVAVLEGGLNGWRNAGFDIEEGEAKAAKPVTRNAPEMNHDLVRDYDDVLGNIVVGADQLVDVRAYARFTGEAPSHGERPGHIPGAVSLPFAGCLDKDTNGFQSIGEMGGIARDAGLDFSRPIVAYCGGGGSSPVVALGLYTLGKQDVAIYDGAWEDWCRHDGSPSETGDPGSAS